VVDRTEQAAPDGGADAMRDAYARHRGGAEGWYREFGGSYRNPHEDAVAFAVDRLVRTGAVVDGQRVLDLACGSGEVWRTLRAAGFAAESLTACDPFTAVAFEQLNAAPCRADSFADIAAGSLAADGLAFDHVICAYAMHLCEPSRLAGLGRALTTVTPVLHIVTPHKRPVLREDWGWRLTGEHYDAGFRVRTRSYSRT
jgi:SAM-dependent methyltransferase